MEAKTKGRITFKPQYIGICVMRKRGAARIQQLKYININIMCGFRMKQSLRAKLHTHTQMSYSNLLRPTLFFFSYFSYFCTVVAVVLHKTNHSLTENTITHPTSVFGKGIGALSLCQCDRPWSVLWHTVCGSFSYCSGSRHWKYSICGLSTALSLYLHAILDSASCVNWDFTASHTE